MRPRAIQGVPGLDADLSPFERFGQFARVIVSVPKAEADKQKLGLEKKRIQKTRSESKRMDLL